VSIINLWYYINGYILISIQGKGTERLINLAINRGIFLRDIRRYKKKALMKVDSEEFKRLRPLVRKTRCKVRIEEKVGLPFFIYRLTIRKGFIAGFVFFILALYTLSSFVWFVEIDGTEKIDPREVKEATRELGLHPGVFKDSLDLEDISKDLVLKVPDISWAGIEISGTRAKVQIIEKIKGTEYDPEFKSHIVAEKDGIILEIFVVEGQAVVSEGDTVSAGDTLISGLISFEEGEVEDNDEPLEDREKREMHVRARGTVEARVWYEGHGHSTLLIEKLVPTGNYETGSFLRIGEREIFLWGVLENPYEFSKKDLVKRTFDWRNILVPVEIVSLRFTELTAKKEKLTPEEALERAKQQALKEAKEQIPSGVSPEEEYYEILETKDDQVYKVRYVMETIEDIGIEQGY